MRIALCIGEPNGIGPETAVKAARRFANDLEPILVGDEAAIRRYGSAGSIVDVKALPAGAFKPGTMDPRAGRATVDDPASVVETLSLLGGIAS